VQFRLLTAVIVFLGSYLPLSLILLAQDFNYEAPKTTFCWRIWEAGCRIPLKNPRFAVSIFIACALCFLVTLIVLAVLKPKQEIFLVESKYIPTDLMNYTLPYVVSFMSIDYHDTAKFVGLVIFLGWMFWITYKSGQILLNPLLIVFGWRLYELKYRYTSDPTKQEYISRALSKGAIEAGDTCRQINVSDILAIKPEPRHT
jgi:LSD1 subclass zinc finger protein